MEVAAATTAHAAKEVVPVAHGAREMITAKAIQADLVIEAEVVPVTMVAEAVVAVALKVQAEVRAAAAVAAARVAAIVKVEAKGAMMMKAKVMLVADQAAVITGAKLAAMLNLLGEVMRKTITGMKLRMQRKRKTQKELLFSNLRNRSQSLSTQKQ